MYYLPQPVPESDVVLMRRIDALHLNPPFAGACMLHDRLGQEGLTEFVALIQGHDIQVSMDGKGRWVDNVLVERLWKSVKYEEVYLHAYDTVTQAREGLHALTFYNERRPPSSLDGATPPIACTLNLNSSLSHRQNEAN